MRETSMPLCATDLRSDCGVVAVVRAAIRFLDPSYLGSGCKRMYPKPTRTRPAFADDGRTRTAAGTAVTGPPRVRRDAAKYQRHARTIGRGDHTAAGTSLEGRSPG